MSDFLDLFGIKGISQINQHNTDMLRNSFMLGLQRQETQRLQAEELERKRKEQERLLEQQRNSAILGGIGSIAGSFIPGMIDPNAQASSKYLASQAGQILGQTLGGGAPAAFDSTGYSKLVQEEAAQGITAANNAQTQRLNLAKANQQVIKEVGDLTRQLIEKDYNIYDNYEEAAIDASNYNTTNSIRQIQYPDGTMKFVATIPGLKDQLAIAQSTQNLSSRESDLKQKGAIVGDEASIKAAWSAMPSNKKKIAPYFDPQIQKWVAVPLSDEEVRTNSFKQAQEDRYNRQLNLNARNNEIYQQNTNIRLAEFNEKRGQMGDVERNQVSEYSNYFNSDTIYKEHRQSYDAILNIESLLKEAGNSGAATGILQSQIARVLGNEKGALSEGDVQRVTGSRDLWNQLMTIKERAIKGKMTDSDLAAFNSITKTLKSKGESKLSSLADNKLNMTAKSQGWMDAKGNIKDPDKVNLLKSLRNDGIGLSTYKNLEVREQNKSVINKVKSGTVDTNNRVETTNGLGNYLLAPAGQPSKLKKKGK